MSLFNIFKKKNLYEKSSSKLLIDIEFANRTDREKVVWVEPTCVEFNIGANTEYRIVTHDKFFRIEFDSNDRIIFYLQYSFGFKLYKRPVSEEVHNPNNWILDDDTSEIN